MLEDLRAIGLIRGEEAYTHTVPFSHRSGARVEPIISLQWFCDMTRLAEPAIAAVEQGRVRFTPPKWGEVYLNWMREIRPWCVSRQLWWGHQIPVWYRGEEIYVGLTEPRGRRLGAGPRRPRHVVQLRAVAVRHARDGPSGRPSWRSSTRPTSSRRRATSSSCGSPAW